MNNLKYIVFIILVVNYNYLQSQVCNSQPFQFQTCNPIISPPTFVVDSDTAILDMNGGCYWVCSGVFFTCAGVNSEIYAEGGSISPTGPSTTVVLQGGAENVIFFRGVGVNDQLLIEPGSQFNWVRRSPSVPFTDLGTDTQDSVCFGLFIYDYTQAPPNGCSGTTGIFDTNSLDEYLTHWILNDKLFISIKQSNRTPVQMNIFNGSAMLMHSDNIVGNEHDHETDLSSFTSGVYFVELIQQSGRNGFKFIIY